MNKTLHLIAAAAAGIFLLPGCNSHEEIESTPPASTEAKPLPEGLHVYSYTPAPGQFIGDATLGGMPEMPANYSEACEWAEQRLAQQRFVSLGAFGGYITVSLGEAIGNGDGADFAIAGNAFLNSGTSRGGSNEPGIVYVMPDTNGNALPDDTWYELAGSDTFDPSTRRNYWVTYYRPQEEGEPVRWVDSEGMEGQVDYLKLVHPQPSYFPEWVVAAGHDTTDSYTLVGTCLASRTTQAESGQWDSAPFSWGYADNIGSDMLGEEGQWNSFDISNAIDADGNPVKLDKVHFIMVQTGVNAKAGGLGEVSTEVCGFKIIK